MFGDQVRFGLVEDFRYSDWKSENTDLANTRGCALKIDKYNVPCTHSAIIFGRGGLSMNVTLKIPGVIYWTVSDSRKVCNFKLHFRTRTEK